MSDLRPLSSSISKLTSATFSKKFVALGRVLNNWNDVIGSDMAVKAQPNKLIYRKPKNKGDKPQATLEIAATSADATILHYQKDLILARINQLFGDEWITAIRFVHIAANAGDDDKFYVPRNHVATPLTHDMKSELDKIDDLDIKESLDRLAQGIMRRQQKAAK